MNLYEFLTEEGEGDWGKIFFYAAASGMANAGVLAIISRGIKTAGELTAWLLVLFAVVCIFYALSYRRCVELTTALVESALYRVRIRLCEKIRYADLHRLEQIGLSALFDQIMQQSIIISNGSWAISLLLQAATFTCFMIVYIAFLSKFGLVMVCFFCCTAIYIYRRHSLSMAKPRAAFESDQSTMLAILSDLIGGSKEVRLRTRRGDELLLDYKKSTGLLRDHAGEMHTLNQEHYIILTVSIFALMAVVVFVIPENATISTRSLNALTAAIIFIYTPLSIIKTIAPDYGRIAAAATNLRTLEHRLDDAATGMPAIEADPWAGRFSEISLSELRFDHTDASSRTTFSLGPIRLSLRAGSITFFVGGNGSGKTTLLKLLAALYTPKSGELLVDGIPVSAQNVRAYQSMFSAVFTDFHLFLQLYGLSDLPEEQVNAKLEQLQIRNKTQYNKGRFSNLKLSSGQRKRLAMAVALLEDRPIYIFDEWAADQDPEFRRYYYEQLLPELRRQGKTVLAISHDDRYFTCADQIVFIENGIARTATAH